MVGEINRIYEWLPDEMAPGDIFFIEVDESTQNPHCAWLACPECGNRQKIRRRQMLGQDPVMCVSLKCFAVFTIVNKRTIIPRKII